jgi:hypothetical protein
LALQSLFIQKYLIYIVMVGFICRRNLSTRRKQPSCRRSLTNLITQCCTEYTSPRSDCCLLTCHYCEHAPYLMYMYQPCFFCLMFNVWEEHLLIKSVFSNVVDVKNINLNSSNCFQYNFLSISIYDCWLYNIFWKFTHSFVLSINYTRIEKSRYMLCKT